MPTLAGELRPDKSLNVPDVFLYFMTGILLVCEGESSGSVLEPWLGLVILDFGNGILLLEEGIVIEDPRIGEPFH